MKQEAPDPEALAALVAALEYKPNFEVELDLDLDRGQGSRGATLVITITTPNSYNPEQTRRVAHYMPVPPAAFDRRSWQRWLFEQLLLVERHEACEFFRFEYDTPNRIGIQTFGTNHHVERPYAPSHGPGNDPYLIREVGTVKDVETSFRGDRNS